jgi:hypothetical protein
MRSALRPFGKFTRLLPLCQLFQHHPQTGHIAGLG